MPLASLPWYDHPSTRDSLDRVYRCCRQSLLQRGVARTQVADQLDRCTVLSEQWSDESLCLSQCCGPDLLTRNGQSLRVISRPVFAALDCPAGCYFSYIVTRSQQLDENVDIVVNNATSFSGCTALLHWLQRTGRQCDRFEVSGSHQRSADLVRAGAADVAAIDAQTWQFIERDGLQIIDRSVVAPAPPFVCHEYCKIDRVTMADALLQAFRGQGAPLGITDLIEADNALYDNFFTALLAVPIQQAMPA